MDGPPQVKSFDITVDRQTSRETLRALLHAILFHRLFGVVTPMLLDVLDVTLPAVRDPATERVVDGKVDTFLRAMTAVQQASRLGRIDLIFSEKRTKRGGWFYTGEEQVPWEIWQINTTLRQPTTEDDRESLHAQLSNTLSRAVMDILLYTSSESGRTAVPLISSAEGISPFPWEIKLKVNGADLV